MTCQWNDDHEHVHMTCPEAPKKLNRWRAQTPLTEAMTRPLIDKTVQLLAAQPGFYKLDVEDDHPHW